MNISLIKYNLKKDSYKNILVIAVLSIILAIGNINVLSLSSFNNQISLSDIFINIFGGSPYDVQIEEKLILFLQWFFPHMLILYLINIYISNKLIDDMIIILPRLKSKIKWMFTVDLSLILIIIKYYIVMFFTYGIFSYIFMGRRIFDNSDFKLILSIIILSILMCISFIVALINLNIIFSRNSIANIIFFMLIIISSFIDYSNKTFLKSILINNAMIVRHSIFYNIHNFTVNYSIVYFVCFILVNVIISFLLVNKLDMKRLKIF